MGKVDALADSLVNARVKLRIMATTDLHMQVLPFDYQTGKAADRHGLARTAALITKARGEAENSLLVDNGDFLCGSDADIVADLSHRKIHPMITIMNQLGYDAATLGNHDFDYGLSFLQQTTAQSQFPYVSANVLRTRGVDASQDLPIFAPFTILTRHCTDILGQKHPLRVGITGFLPPQSVSQFDSNPHQIETRDIIEAAQNIVPQMKAAGADIIIALAHSGIGGDTHILNMENATIPLAAIDGIDAIISGHGHQVFPGSNWPENPMLDAKRGCVAGKPVVAPGFWGSHLGLIDLDLQRRGKTWLVKSHCSEARAIFTATTGGNATPSVQSDQAVSSIIKPLHDRVLKEINEPVGTSNKPINSFFALTAPSQAVQEIQRAQIWYTRKHLDQYFDPDLPLLSSSCAFKTGGYGGAGNFTNISPGIVSMRSVVDLYPFPNQMALVQINGTHLHEWLERAASVFTTAIPDGKLRDLIAPDAPGYVYESVLGVSYDIDLSQPARYNQTGQICTQDSQRIQNLAYNGTPVTPDQVFTMITNNHRLGGGGFYPPICLKNRLKAPEVELQHILPAYFKANPEPDAELDRHWRFLPVPGARMRYRTSPQALNQNGTYAPPNLQAKNVDSEGFQVFELSL